VIENPGMGDRIQRNTHVVENEVVRELIVCERLEPTLIEPLDDLIPSTEMVGPTAHHA